MQAQCEAPACKKSGLASLPSQGQASLARGGIGSRKLMGSPFSFITHTQGWLKASLRPLLGKQKKSKMLA